MSHVVKPEPTESVSTPAIISGEDGGQPSASDIVKREIDSMSDSEDTATISPSPGKRRKVATAKAGARAKGSATKNSGPGSKASASPSKQRNSIPGGFTGDQKAAMIEEILVAGMSALGVRNIATKADEQYDGTDRQVYNLLQGGKKGNLRGRIFELARRG